MKVFIAIPLYVLLAACAAPQRVVNIYSSFNANEARFLLEEGTNTIKGSAVVRQQGGGVVTCAGNEVFLIPLTDYAEERVSALYGNTERGFVNPIQSNVKFEPDEPQFRELTRKRFCDAQGFFEFDEVADGEFFVGTSVSWVINYVQQGGYLIHRVAVQGGETEEVVLTP